MRIQRLHNRICMCQKCCRCFECPEICTTGLIFCMRFSVILYRSGTQSMKREVQTIKSDSVCTQQIKRGILEEHHFDCKHWIKFNLFCNNDKWINNATMVIIEIINNDFIKYYKKIHLLTLNNIRKYIHNLKYNANYRESLWSTEMQPNSDKIVHVLRIMAKDQI